MDYFKLRKPFTSVAIASEPNALQPNAFHADIRYFVNGALCGVLTFRRGELASALLAMCNVDRICAWTGESGRPQWVEPLDFDECLIGQDGTIETLVTLRERYSASRNE